MKPRYETECSPVRLWILVIRASACNGAEESTREDVEGVDGVDVGHDGRVDEESDLSDLLYARKKQTEIKNHRQHWYKLPAPIS